MKQLILKVNENKYQFILELLQNFDFVSIENNGDSPEEIKDSIKKGVDELLLYKEGKIQFRNAEELIDEL